ncbi:thiamine biosynthesis lipoprotein ApbE precursor [Variibacter gotjawalensis]|uniref:FAD:protein FMN transferase n=1 Tax=Variibacter gotjawalensis TaxID=1333996 RepID=A0A0S3PZR3_9BRAD|nr:FAD:protein FMN transferase [Variibacter gotjawalensis]NIK47267.1 thiamine biosynthesis lipoprotein [Variibacter gotjawalensis]RZS49167.1 thiamine biosynthesis lipoprotein [Variibacter gotjawalensis]BAT61429.1 thiamine biosynthesis lipoprotein ApbE precursor [Variibacter gotjawalensis]
MRPRHSDAVIVHALGGATMGTTWSVKIVAPDGADTTKLSKAIEIELDIVDVQMSPWRADSNITRFNDCEADRWQTIPRDFFKVLSFAQALAVKTGGAYDPTAGHLVNLWGFGPPQVNERPPSAEAIADALTRCGYEKLRLDTKTHTAYQPGGITLDLSSIAKGFAVDQIARLLESIGLIDYLVEVGGELRGSGMKPDATPWWVTLETPGAARETVVALHGLSVATSGEAQRYFDRDDARYSHTIDPRDGWPVRNGVVSVTVVGDECMVADAWATALTVLGPDTGLALAEQTGVAASMIWREGDIREAATSRFAALEQE